MYSLHAHHSVKNIVLIFWNVNIHFYYINISQKKLYLEIHWGFDINNQEALYWENINQGDVLQGMPVVEMTVTVWIGTFSLSVPHL